MSTMLRALSSCRLYSCIRFTWISKRKFEGMFTPSRSRMMAESCSFFCCLMALNRAMVASSMWFLSPWSRSRSSRKSRLPSRSSISPVSSGLHKPSQRRWVMPLVLLQNFSGYRAYQSGSSSRLISSLWILATPFT